MTKTLVQEVLSRRPSPREQSADSERVDPAVRRLRLFSLIALLLTLFVVIPALNLAGIVEDHNVNRLGRYLCFAIAALGIDLIWGYAGALSLCQAFLFCLGGYAIAMHLSLPAGGGDVRPEYHNIPQFFFFNNVDVLPTFWKPFSSLWFALGAAIALPALVATIFGFFIFKNRVRGVYFAIITQALAWAAFLSFCRNEMLLGGTNGLTNFYKPLNQHRSWILGLYVLSATVLELAFLVCRILVRSRLGHVLIAIRDNETRLRFSGYRPEHYKVFAFAVAAVLAAIGGILYVPQNGIVTPQIMRVEDSILFVIWVALGGRGRLWGAVFGALIVSYAYSTLTSDLPEAWPFIQGAMFLSVALLPKGVVGLWDRIEKRLAGRSGVIAAALPLATLAAFIIAEALGLMPGALEKKWLGLDRKYLLLAAVFAGTLLFEVRGVILSQLRRCVNAVATFGWSIPVGRTEQL